jgi:hypothetical protein
MFSWSLCSQTRRYGDSINFNNGRIIFGSLWSLVLLKLLRSTAYSPFPSCPKLFVCIRSLRIHLLLLPTHFPGHESHALCKWTIWGPTNRDRTASVTLIFPSPFRRLATNCLMDLLWAHMPYIFHELYVVLDVRFCSPVATYTARSCN